jgi:hypothetical protein
MSTHLSICTGFNRWANPACMRTADIVRAVGAIVDLL